MDETAEPQSLPLPGSHAPSQTHVSQSVISFGSNHGDRRELVASAAAQIAASEFILPGETLQTSRLFETPPIGGPGGQEPFLNAIGIFQTAHPAREVLTYLQELVQSL